MNIHIKRTALILLSVVLVLSSLLVVISHLVRSTILSEKFYNTALSSPNYTPMIIQAISFEFDAQSRFTGIPLEYFTAAIDEEIINEMLKEHVKNAVGFLKNKKDFERKNYPQYPFTSQFNNFITFLESENSEFEADEILYSQLAEVSLDSSEIVDKHVNILRFDAVNETGMFSKIQNTILFISNIFIPSLIASLLAVILLIVIQKNNIQKASFYIFTSLWITGTLFFIPGIVMHQSGISRRFAINNTYFKFAIDTWLSKIGDYILYAGALLFILSSVFLAGRFFHTRIFNKENDLQ